MTPAWNFVAVLEKVFLCENVSSVQRSILSGFQSFLARQVTKKRDEIFEELCKIAAILLVGDRYFLKSQITYFTYYLKNIMK